MRKLILGALSLVWVCCLQAQNLSGYVKDAQGNLLAFSSILIKGTTRGVSANAKGFYSMSLEPGSYTLVCQYIGFQAQEKTIRIANQAVQLDFVLEPQRYDLKEVVVRTGGEDPAYPIIRKAIAKRPDYLYEIKKFTAEVYIKGQLQLRDYPNRFFGRKITFDDGDSSKKKMIFLSETLARYSVEAPAKAKVEVLSTKVSGRSGAFGFSDPELISFYENIVPLGDGLNPRGFISPIASGALNYYRYKFEGTFYENGKEISRIRVIPKRKYEPLFSGYINIIEDEWRLHSLRLQLLRDQQMQLLDSLTVEQLYVPSGTVWVVKNQVVYPSGKIFGFDFFGSFVQVYDRYDLNPAFGKKYFDNIVLKFYDSSNKKSMAYWDSIRPLPLLPEELTDYRKKDSIEKVRNDPRYMDSVDRKRNKFTLSGLVFTGHSFTHRKNKTSLSAESLLSSLNYNVVEGPVVSYSPVWRKRFEGRRSLQITPYLRYGIANQHFNAYVTTRYTFGKKYFNSVFFSAGRRVTQFNNAQPVGARNNSIATLFFENNHLKIYEANFLRLGYNAGLGKGLTFSASIQYQDRFPLENLQDPVYWKDHPSRDFTPNYPTELVNVNMQRNQAAMANLGLVWRPGGKYIEFPDRTVGIGSKYPTVSLNLIQGVRGLLGSDVDYTRWRVSANDELELKMGGNFNYRVEAGGFLRKNQVYLPDYQHFIGNQTVVAVDPLSGFQLAPYYRYSNTSTFYTTLHAEYHLNGLLTNKIPGFRKFNWFLVLGGSFLHVKDGKNYGEVSVGLENIFKLFRVDYVRGYEQHGLNLQGIRIHLPFFLDRRLED